MTSEEQIDEIMDDILGMLRDSGLRRRVAAALHAAQAEEREACAKIAHEWQEIAYESWANPRRKSQICGGIAAAIRARK